MFKRKQFFVGDAVINLKGEVCEVINIMPRLFFPDVVVIAKFTTRRGDGRHASRNWYVDIESINYHSSIFLRHYDYIDQLVRPIKCGDTIILKETFNLHYNRKSLRFQGKEVVVTRVTTYLENNKKTYTSKYGMEWNKHHIDVLKTNRLLLASTHSLKKPPNLPSI